MKLYVWMVAIVLTVSTLGRLQAGEDTPRRPGDPSPEPPRKRSEDTEAVRAAVDRVDSSAAE